MLGRLVTRWPEVVGADLADKAQPVKIRYYKKKPGQKRASASLDIAASTADATLLHYRKDLILERINRIFGDKWITAIRFVPMSSNAPPPAHMRKKRKKPLSAEEDRALSDSLEDINDPEMQERLKSLGAAILQDS